MIATGGMGGAYYDRRSPPRGGANLDYNGANPRARERSPPLDDRRGGGAYDRYVCFDLCFVLFVLFCVIIIYVVHCMCCIIY
jgi:hypothetical protein